MKSTIKLILVVALVVAACVAIVIPVATASPATASQPVLLVCTSAAGLNYAIQVFLDSHGSGVSNRASEAMATTLGEASRQAGSPWLSLAHKLSTAVSDLAVTGAFGPINSAFGSLARACRAHGDPIFVLTLKM
jgi:hypothetical protein